MATRSLDQIVSSLGSVYDPQVQSIRNQQNLIPESVANEEKGLQAKQTQAFDDILGGARRRGMGFAGIPLAEQAKYTSTEFLPALARLRQDARQKQMSLEDAILGINERRNTSAQQIYQNELNLDEQRRQFDENLRFQREQMAAQQRAAAASSFSPSFGNSAPSGGGSKLPAGMEARTDKLGKFTGFNFTVNNKPVSAAQYAAANKIPIGDLLYRMGESGDTTAQSAYNWIKYIQTNNPGLWNSGSWKKQPAYQRYSSLFWGT